MPSSPARKTAPLRHWVVVLGDQLNDDASALTDFDPKQDAIWMAEVMEESTHVMSSKPRTAVFLSAMRHFADRLRAKGWPVRYTLLDAADNTGSLAGELARTLAERPAQGLVMTAPGDWRVLQALRGVAREHGVGLDVRDDPHFFCTVRDFAQHAAGRKSLRMEFFYREMRRKTGFLMDGDQPAGGQWNFDADNRGHFGTKGPGLVPPPSRFAPDDITQTVLELVAQHLAHHPGQLDRFAWPVTREQALQALADFVEHRLPSFGLYQDAMWRGEAWLYHSHLSCALNLKLLNPREVILAAQSAWQAGHAPLSAVEGFVRQILGWREYVRGIYWTQMPSYAARNALNAQGDLPQFYWDGQTDMDCLRDAITQTLQYGYAHHIQRLMVTGMYAHMLGVKPEQIHQWYLGVYVDAVEWVELPNTLGMSQYADGGLMASKPYVATGQYIARMSNHCTGCRYDPKQSTGPTACPFTTLYWDYLLRHESTLAANPRMALSLKHLSRFSPEQREAIAAQANGHRRAVG